MSGPISRRRALQLGASSAAALLAACGGAPMDPRGYLLLPPRKVPEGLAPRQLLEEIELADALEVERAIDWDPRAVAFDAGSFPLGVQAGGPRADSVNLWGYTEVLEETILRVWREVNGGILLDHEDVLRPGPGGAFRTLVQGLRAGCEYHYALFNNALTLRSAVGRFRTAFAPDALRPLTLGCLTCTNHGKVSRFRALEELARHEVDLLVHLGDMSYNDGADTLDEYRAKWRETLSDPGYLAALPKAGMVMSWDDHEFVNNIDPTAIAPEKMAAATDSFFEMVPMERGPDGQLWSRYRWGLTAEVIVLDTRTERIPSGEDKRYISDAQMAFFKEALATSPCHFKIVLNSVPITQMPPIWLNQSDRWQGYEAQRDEITGFLEDNAIENVWFLSGDFHTGFVSRVAKAGYLSSLWEIAVGPSGNFGNPLAMGADAGVGVEAVFPSDQFEYGSGRMAATLLTFDPLLDEVRIQFLDPDTGEAYYDERLSQAS